MSDLKPNAELAYKVLDQIDAHPGQWDQGQWYIKTDCGTSACFAGWAVVLAGHRVEMEATPDHRGRRSYGLIDGSDLSVAEVATRDLRIGDAEVECRSCEDCGYKGLAADALFDAGNTREDLGSLVAEIFGPRPCVNCPPGYDCERGNYATGGAA